MEAGLGGGPCPQAKPAQARAKPSPPSGFGGPRAQGLRSCKPSQARKPWPEYWGKKIIVGSQFTLKILLVGPYASKYNFTAQISVVLDSCKCNYWEDFASVIWPESPNETNMVKTKSELTSTPRKSPDRPDDLSLKLQYARDTPYGIFVSSHQTLRTASVEMYYWEHMSLFKRERGKIELTEDRPACLSTQLSFDKTSRRFAPAGMETYSIQGELDGNMVILFIKRSAGNTLEQHRIRGIYEPGIPNREMQNPDPTWSTENKGREGQRTEFKVNDVE
ncbi:hypothetical protein C8R47DRAFT_1075261 [Mycena vitilis]|nr:hypothetical protein C8R47DRAFT_1075261 [Mycena vitilis]